MCSGRDRQKSSIFSGINSLGLVRAEGEAVLENIGAGTFSLVRQTSAYIQLHLLPTYFGKMTEKLSSAEPWSVQHRGTWSNVTY